MRRLTLKDKRATRIGCLDVAQINTAQERSTPFTELLMQYTVCSMHKSCYVCVSQYVIIIDLTITSFDIVRENTEGFMLIDKK